MIDDLIAAAGLVVPPVYHDPTIPLNPAFLWNVGLRDYQHLMLLEAARLMRQGYKRILLVAPTGAGKTVMAAALMRSASLLAMTSEFIVHRKELIKQTSRSFDERGINHGFIASGWGFDPQQVTLAGVQTLVGRLDGLFPPNTAILDEAHHATSDTWARVLSHYDGCYVIGFTATPCRLDGRGLKEQFDVMVMGPSVATLIARGFLSPYEFYAPDIPDMSNVPVEQGEFQKAGAAAIMGDTKVVGNIVEQYLTLAPGEQGIVFAVNRDTSRKYADAFKAHGIPAMHVDGAMSRKERDYFDDAFRAGDVRMGINVNLFGEGYDVPNVSYMADCAPSRSRINVTQRWGRPLRLFPGKTRAIISDHAGNALPTWLGGRGHGLPDDEVEYTLEGTEKRKSTVSDDATPITQCTNCFLVYPSARPACPRCGRDVPAKPREVQTDETRKMTKLEREELRKLEAERRKAEERECKTFKEFLSLGRARGYAKARGWAKQMCALRRIPVPPT